MKHRHRIYKFSLRFNRSIELSHTSFFSRVTLNNLNLPFFMDPTTNLNQRWNWQQPSSSHPMQIVYSDPFLVQYWQQLAMESHWQQLVMESHWQLQANASMAWAWCNSEGLYGPSPYSSPVYGETAQYWPGSYHWQQQYNAPSLGPSDSGPSHNKPQQFRKAEHQYKYQRTHELSGRIPEDRSTGTDLGHAQIGAKNKSGGGKVWRTPSKNPLMVDRNLI